MSKLAEPYCAIARIVKPQGRCGEVAAEILTDFPDRFQKSPWVYLENGEGAPRPFNIERAWLHKGRVVLKFAGIETIDQAGRLRGRHVLIPREERTRLPENHYYPGDLIGCRVVREVPGRSIEVGTVTAIESTGGVGLLHIAPAGCGKGEILVPLAQAICPRIDVQAKTIVIDPPEDLLELNER